jgi:hypothetical protein
MDIEERRRKDRERKREQRAAGKAREWRLGLSVEEQEALSEHIEAAIYGHSDDVVTRRMPFDGLRGGRRRNAIELAENVLGGLGGFTVKRELDNLVVTGYASDIDRAFELFRHVHTNAVALCTAWWKADPRVGGPSVSPKQEWMREYGQNRAVTLSNSRGVLVSQLKAQSAIEARDAALG